MIIKFKTSSARGRWDLSTHAQSGRLTETRSEAKPMSAARTTAIRTCQVLLWELTLRMTIVCAPGQVRAELKEGPMSTRLGPVPPAIPFPSDKERLLTLKEAADRLGISLRTLEDWIYDKRIEVESWGAAARESRKACIDHLIEVQIGLLRPDWPNLDHSSWLSQGWRLEETCRSSIQRLCTGAKDHVSNRR